MAAAVLQSPGGMSTTVQQIECPKSKVGRVIGKGGDTIKALQQYTGAIIQIDQSIDPTRVTVAGNPDSLQLAVSMIRDIVQGSFKGFAMLRQVTGAGAAQTVASQTAAPQQQPVYVQGWGFVPPSQLAPPEVRSPRTPSILAANAAGSAVRSAPASARNSPQRLSSSSAESSFSVGHHDHTLGFGGGLGSQPGSKADLQAADMSRLLDNARLMDALGLLAASQGAPAGTSHNLGALQMQDLSALQGLAGMASHNLPASSALVGGASLSAGLGNGGSLMGGLGAGLGNAGMAGNNAVLGSGALTNGMYGGGAYNNTAYLGNAGAAANGQSLWSSPAASPAKSNLSSTSLAANWTQAAAEPSSVPPGWLRLPDPDGRIFYHCLDTRRSQWDPPAAF